MKGALQISLAGLEVQCILRGLGVLHGVLMCIEGLPCGYVYIMHIDTLYIMMLHVT